MKPWRPDGWGEKRSAFLWRGYKPEKVDEGSEIFYPDEYKAFEAGADALWDALWELAKESPTGKFEIDSHVEVM